MRRRLTACLLAALLGAAVASATPLGTGDAARRLRPGLRGPSAWHTLLDHLAPLRLEAVPEAVGRVDWAQLADDLVRLPGALRRFASGAA